MGLCPKLREGCHPQLATTTCSLACRHISKRISNDIRFFCACVAALWGSAPNPARTCQSWTRRVVFGKHRAAPHPVRVATLNWRLEGMIRLLLCNSVYLSVRTTSSACVATAGRAGGSPAFMGLRPKPRKDLPVLDQASSF